MYIIGSSIYLYICVSIYRQDICYNVDFLSFVQTLALKFDMKHFTNPSKGYKPKSLWHLWLTLIFAHTSRVCIAILI